MTPINGNAKFDPNNYATFKVDVNQARKNIEEAKENPFHKTAMRDGLITPEEMFKIGAAAELAAAGVDPDRAFAIMSKKPGLQQQYEAAQAKVLNKVILPLTKVITGGEKGLSETDLLTQDIFLSQDWNNNGTAGDEEDATVGTQFMLKNPEEARALILKIQGDVSILTLQIETTTPNKEKHSEE
jgi:hypothetical protein